VVPLQHGGLQRRQIALRRGIVPGAQRLPQGQDVAGDGRIQLQRRIRVQIGRQGELQLLQLQLQRLDPADGLQSAVVAVHRGHRLAGGDVQRHVVQHLGLFAVGEGDIVHVHAALYMFEGPRVRRGPSGQGGGPKSGKGAAAEAEFFEAAPLAAAAGGHIVRGGNAAVPGRAVSAGILL